MGSNKQDGYEVFLSFKGEDTRKGFVDHLYEQMKDAGIIIFKDNINLPFGEKISTSLLKAIELSKIGMPILSKNYAASRWCLDELVCMLECRNTKKQSVLPIFYDVTPSQVRHQTFESYTTAFADHANKYDEETMKKWRKALAEVSTLKGLELEKESRGHEGQLTKKIIGKLLLMLKKSHLELLTDKLVRIDDQEKEVTALLAMLDTNDVRKVVGLWGMGGIGKTTLAKFIYNQILDKFDSCSFLGDIRENSRDLAFLQSRLVSDLSRKERRDFSSVEEGVKHLKFKFHEKKVLILLDDVDHIDQLKALAEKVNWFGPGSRIIVTTRDKSILDDLLGLADDKDIAEECWWACYEVKEMNKEKSLELFCKHAFRQEVPEDKLLSDLSHAIVNTTGGLPLALEVIGSCLYRKRMAIWEETLKKLKKMPRREVQERLNISYERLEEDQKQMFLDVACLFIGEEIDTVMHVWKDRDFCAETGKDALLVMSLIKIVDNKIWMHDQLRDLGREIVRKENDKEPCKRSRLWQDDEARAAIANNSMVYGSSSEVEALALGYTDQYSNWISLFHYKTSAAIDHWITSEQLRNHSNIWFLKLHRVNLIGNFQHLLSKLRWLSWKGFSENCSPANLNLEKLIFLDISSSFITDDSKLWSSFQSSMKLKVLKLAFCDKLTILDVSMFNNLERLFLTGCEFLKKILVGKLNCTGPEKLPRIYKLKSLKISCHNLQEIEGLDQLEALEELILFLGCSIKKLPSLSKLKSLKRLNCVGCEKLEEIEGLDQLEALEELILFLCCSIKKLPSLSKLKSLKRLNCVGCEKLEEIEGLDQLEALKELDLSKELFTQNLEIKVLSVEILTQLYDDAIAGSNTFLF